MRLPTWQKLLRFRLRTLLLAITVASVWLGFHVRSARLQERSVAAIAKYGGWVRYDFQFPSGEYFHKSFDRQARSSVPNWLLDRLGVDFFHDVVLVNLNYSEDSGARKENHNPSDEALQYLGGFPKLRILLLSDTQASDSSMRHLAQLKRLERLYMWDAVNVSDAGVAHLSELHRLRYIHLSTSQITDKSLAVFAKLPMLEGLSLQFNQFSDKGLRHLSQLDELESLWVCGKEDEMNQITDSGLRYLKNLKALTELGIQRTHVSDDGVQEFLRAVPGCKLHR
jgi:Leucine-rich repeat (LRR) protein